jgi:hypothetical protein
VRLPLPIGDAWRALTALPPARGELAGYTGTAVLEEADEDVHVAVFRLQGTAGTAAATATLTAALAPASDGTSLAFELDLHPGHGAAVTADEILAALDEIVPAARAAGEEAAKEAAARDLAAREAAHATPPPATPTSAAALSPAAASPPAPSDSPAAPTWSATVDWVEPGATPPHRPPARRSPPTGALVAAGAAAALAAWALRRRS